MIDKSKSNSVPFLYVPVCISIFYIAGNFFPAARSHWLLRGRLTFNNETLSRQNLRAGNILKSITSESNSAHVETAVTSRFNEFQASKFPVIQQIT